MASCWMAESLPSGVAASLMRCDGGGAAADRAEHLLAAEGELTGFCTTAAAMAAEDDVRPDGAFGAEAAADEWALDVDVFGRDGEGAGEGRAVAGDALGGVVDVELVAVPRGDGGVRLHGVVVLDRRGVGLVDGDGGLGERGVGIAAVRVRRGRGSWAGGRR